VRRAIAITCVLAAAAGTAAFAGEPVVLELGYGQISRTVQAAMRKTWYRDDCARLDGSEPLKSAIFKNQCLNREFFYKQRTMTCPGSSTDADDCWDKTACVKHNRDKVDPCDAEVSRLEGLYRCGEIPVGAIAWPEIRVVKLPMQILSTRRFRSPVRRTGPEPARRL
jgi:hypothetical protein